MCTEHLRLRVATKCSVEHHLRFKIILAVRGQTNNDISSRKMTTFGLYLMLLNFNSHAIDYESNTLLDICPILIIVRKCPITSKIM